MIVNKLLAVGVLITSLNTVVIANTEAQPVFKVAHINSVGVLNVRKNPAANSKVILQLPSDSSWILKRTAEHSGRWQKVVWGVKEGWVYDYYLDADNQASQQLEEYQQCVANNPGNSLCCGYKSTSVGRNRSGKTPPIKTFMVINVATGQSLNVREHGSVTARKVATIPHNAVGIVKFPGKQVKSRNVVWQKIRWNGKDGWVNAAYLKYDPIISDYRNIVQDLCSAQVAL